MIVDNTSLRELFYDSNLRSNMIFACIIWSCSMFNFYLITFYLKYFPGSIFKNSIYFAMADFISFVVSGTLLKKTNANKTLFVSFIIAGIGSINYLLFY